jgi:hypothetical protein
MPIPAGFSSSRWTSIPGFSFGKYQFEHRSALKIMYVIA